MDQVVTGMKGIALCIPTIMVIVIVIVIVIVVTIRVIIDLDDNDLLAFASIDGLVVVVA